MCSVTVLMSTYNGEKYLKEQIDSILNQIGVLVNLIVRDDGSTDKTKTILQSYAEHGKLNWYSGDNLGAAYSFMDLIKHVSDSDYYAFSDQDDIWDSDKLQAAVNVLNKYHIDDIVLYSCRSRIVDQNNQLISNSNTNLPVTTYIDSLIHNNNQGCTMVFGASLLKLLKQYNGKNLLMHDYLALKVCLAVGGTVIKDSNAYMGYRQHGNNVIGTHEPFLHSFKRRFHSFINHTCERSKELKDVYDIYGKLIPEENKEILEKIAFYKERHFGALKVIFDKRIIASNKKTTWHFRLGILMRFF